MNATGWAVPENIDVEKLPKMVWSLGYRKMIRFYAVTVWPTLAELGYEWVMRMDDDSFMLSRITYNLFDAMRENNDLYAYRMLSAECPRTFSEFVRSFASSKAVTERAGLSQDILEAKIAQSNVDVAFISMCTKFPRHCRAPFKRQKIRDEVAKLDIDAHPELVAFAVARGMPYCAAIGQYGFYNNFFITNIQWWLTEPNVVAMIQAFDDSKLIFTHRSNDLIFQTAVIRLFMPPSRRSRFVDFSYQHHTMRQGVVVYGGIESGTNDLKARRRLLAYAKTFGGDVSTCKVKSRYDSPPVDILFVNPGTTSTAPFCGPKGLMNFV